MAIKLRKQIYLDPEQDRLLKELSRRSGLSEAEIIRNAIDRHAGAPISTKGRHEIWKKEEAFIKTFMGKGTVKGKRVWKRDELHER